MRHPATILIILTIFILGGCGQSALLTLGKDEKYNTILTQTQKKQLTDSATTLGLFRTTYLNPLYPDEYRGKEYFFIGLYLQDDFKRDKGGLNNPHYSLTMNGQSYAEAMELEKSDPLYKQMPLTERWIRYYLVSFEDNSSAARMNVTLKKDSGESLSFTFARFREEL